MQENKTLPRPPTGVEADDGDERAWGRDLGKRDVSGASSPPSRDRAEVGGSIPHLGVFRTAAPAPRRFADLPVPAETLEAGELGTRGLKIADLPP